MGREPKVRTHLDRCFPAPKEVSIGDFKVTISPLMVKQIPKVATAFERVLKLRADGRSDTDIIMDCLEEMLEVLAVCVNVPIEQIPSALLPDLVEAFIEQNLSMDVLGKWRALGLKILGVLGPGAAEGI